MRKFIVSIDAGTTSNRAILFDLKGKPVFSSQKEFTQYFPKSGWVEHDPEEIWRTTVKTLKDVIAKAKKTKMEKITIEGADLAIEIGKKVNEDFDNKKLPLMLAMINAIIEDKKLKLDWELFR